MQPDLAEARQARLAATAERAALRAQRLWRRRFTGGDFDAAWRDLTGPLTAVAAAAQVEAARGASVYLAATARADGAEPRAELVEPAAFAGVDGSGRDVEGLLYGAVTTAKTRIGEGAGLQAATVASVAYLVAMVRTAVMDTGRSADLTAAAARSYTSYVRVVSPGACSRCAILAGMQSSATPFKRHPACKCTAAPEHGGAAATERGRYRSPADYFESLSHAEQDRVFTKAGAEAIRLGADPVMLVSGRRGATGIEYSRRVLDGRTLPGSRRRIEKTVIGRRADGSPILGYTTGEGTTVRGGWGRAQARAGAAVQKRADDRYRTVRRVRLMPETILQLTDDVELRKVLLRDAGYLQWSESWKTQTDNSWVARRALEQADDRATAEAFYRALGIHA